MIERHIDMNYLIFAWQDECQDHAYYLDIETGCVELVEPDLIDLDDLTDEIERNRERYLYVPKPDPSELRGDLEDFTATVGAPELARLLPVALEAPDIQAACRKVLSRNPVELERWEKFRTERVQKRIERWLRANFVSSGQRSIDLGPCEE